MYIYYEILLLKNMLWFWGNVVFFKEFSIFCWWGKSFELVLFWIFWNWLFMDIVLDCDMGNDCWVFVFGLINVFFIGDVLIECCCWNVFWKGCFCIVLKFWKCLFWIFWWLVFKLVICFWEFMGVIGFDCGN